MELTLSTVRAIMSLRRAAHLALGLFRHYMSKFFLLAFPLLLAFSAHADHVTDKLEEIYKQYQNCYKRVS